MADCWECIHMNTQRCEGCTDGYTDGDSWVYFDEPTHFEPKAEVEEMKNYLKSEKIKDGTVEVVIRIPKKEYDYMIANPTRYNVCDDETLLYNYIKGGTPLPKGHGRLIDADAINIHDVSPTYGMEVYGVTQDDIEYEPTVIEADREVDK